MDWLIDSSFVRLIDWLVGLLIDWLIDCLIGCSVHWLIDWLIDWLIVRLIDWLIGRVHRLIDWLADLFFRLPRSFLGIAGDDVWVGQSGARRVVNVLVKWERQHPGPVCLPLANTGPANRPACLSRLESRTGRWSQAHGRLHSTAGSGRS